MEKPELEMLLNNQINGLTDYVNGYKACAKFLVDNWDKKKEENGTGIQANSGTP